MGIRMKWGKPSPLPPEEPVILEQRRFRAVSSFTAPSYRIGFNLPPFWQIRLLVTNRRCLVLTDFFHCMTQEIVMWFPGQNPEDDLEVITRISCRKGIFGQCLEIRTHNPERRQRWLWSPNLTLRFFLKNPHRIESDILAQMSRRPAPSALPAKSRFSD